MVLNTYVLFYFFNDCFLGVTPKHNLCYVYIKLMMALFLIMNPLESYLYKLKKKIIKKSLLSEKGYEIQLRHVIHIDSQSLAHNTWRRKENLEK